MASSNSAITSDARTAVTRFTASQGNRRRVVAMTLKAAGLNPQAAWAPWVSRLAYRLIRRRGARTAQALAA